MSNRKRVNLSISSEDYDVLLRYSNAVGSTPTSVIHSVISEVLPSFEKITEIALQAQIDQGSAISEVQGLALQKISEISSFTADLTTAKDK